MSAEANSDFVVLLVRYSRSAIIGNEPQFTIQVLAGLTCYAADDSEKVSFIIMGESGGGKTHLNKCFVGEPVKDGVERKIRGLLPHEHVKHMTTGSPKAMIYSDELRDASSPVRFINFAELQKLEQDHIEFMKGLSGDDNAFVYEVVDMSTGGTKVITQPKRNYALTFAQVNILDKELQTRLLQIPIEENRLINQCVVDIKFGAKVVDYRGREYDFNRDTDLEDHLRKRIEALGADDPVNCIIPFPRALRGLVNEERPESKRHAQMIASLLKSSARVNYMQRDMTDDGDVVVGAQDIVNVLVAYDILQSTMTGIDIVDLAIYNYLAGVGMLDDKSNPMPKTPSEIVRRVAELGLTEMTQGELERRLKRLINENFVIRVERDKANDYRYTVNRYKQMMTPTVDWNAVYEHDSSTVIDPLTETVYDDIRAYGSDLDRRKSSKALMIALEVDGDPKATRHRMAVARALSSDLRFNDLHDLQRHCLASMGQCDMTDFALVKDVVNSMVADGIIEIDDKYSVIRLRDPSLYTMQQKEKGQSTFDNIGGKLDADQS